MPPLSNLPAAVSREILSNLHLRLPPLPAGAGAEARADRVAAAWAVIVALAPRDAFQAALAEQFALADAHARAAMADATAADPNRDTVRRCRAQAVSLLRQSQQAFRVLLKARAESAAARQDRQAAPEAAMGYDTADPSVVVTTAPVPTSASNGSEAHPIQPSPRPDASPVPARPAPPAAVGSAEAPPTRTVPNTAASSRTIAEVPARAASLPSPNRPHRSPAPPTLPDRPSPTPRAAALLGSTGLVAQGPSGLASATVKAA
jgi:hypothetical protein